MKSFLSKKSISISDPGECETSRTIKFLEDYKSSCLIHLQSDTCQQNHLLNGNSYFGHFFVISSPRLFISRNASTSENSEIFLNVNAHICTADGCKNVTQVPNPTKNCENIVKMIKYEIFHDGSNGIHSVDLFIYLSQSLGEKYFHQKYEYKHFWTSENATGKTK